MAKGDFKNLPVHRIVFSVDTVHVPIVRKL